MSSRTIFFLSFVFLIISCASMNYKKEGEVYLQKNALKNEVIVMPSGLQYTVLNAGSGKKPNSTDLVKVHYHGTFIDGKVFDSSVDRGQPATFPVNKLIKGFTEALTLMPVGSKWRIFIPSDLAYGKEGVKNSIPPNSVLIYEVELLEIK